MFTLRAFDPAGDPPRILELRRQTEKHDQDGTTFSLDAIRAQLSVPGHDPSRDRFMAVPVDNPGKLIGYSSIWASAAEATLTVVVHPEYRRQGLGTILLERVLGRAREMKVRSVIGYTAGSNASGNAFMSNRGFIRQGVYSELRSLLEKPLRTIPLPAGFKIRPYSEVQDIRLLTLAMVDCYAGLWGHHFTTEKQMAEWLPDFDENGLFLMFSPENEVVGISRVEIAGERTKENGRTTGYIDAPGIIPSLRSRDLYLPLLSHGVHWLQQQKAELIDMESWGDETARLASYQAFGFQIIRSQVCCQREVS